MRSRWVSTLVLFGLAAGLFTLPLPVMAQTQTGNIYGTVVDTAGGALPGATVTLDSNVRAQQVVYTDNNGRFRFVDLPPGTYTLTASLDGFATVRREGIQVNVGVSKDIKFTLPPEMEEEMVVTAAAPVVDTRKTGTATNVPYEELQKLPTSRDPWGVLSSVPGVQMDRINISGADSGQQSNFTGKGDNGDNSSYNVDGVTITDAAAVGSSPTYYDFDSFEEIQVTTGGADPSIQTGGVNINFVTRRGTNEFHGSTRIYYTHDKLQGSNLSQSLKDAGFKGNRIQSIAEYGFEVGGPIIKDQLWFWGSAARQDIRQLTIADVSDRTQLNNYAFKLNYQPNADSSVTFLVNFGDKVKDGRQALFTQDQNATWDQTGPTTIYKLEASHLFGSSFYLSGKLAFVDGGFKLDPKGSGPFGYDLTTGEAYNNLWLYDTKRPQYQVNTEGSYYTATGAVDHEFKFGFQYRNTPVETYSTWAGDHGQLTLYLGGPVGLALFYRPYLNDGEITTLSAWIGDTITWKNLTANIGFRFDQQKGKLNRSYGEQSIYVPDLLPRVEIKGGDSPFTWNDLVPRIGLTYSLGSDGKTLLKFNYAQYADQMGIGNVFHTAYNYFQYVYAYFYDANGNRLAEKDEILADYGYGFANMDPKNPTVGNHDKSDPNLVAPRRSEVILGADREIMPNLALGVALTYSRRTDDTWAPYIKVDAAGNEVGTIGLDDWTTDSVINVEVDKNHDGMAEKTIPFQTYTLKDGVFLNPGSGRYLTNRPDYYEEYTSIELTLTKRLADKWMMRFGGSYMDWTQHFDSEAGMFWPYDRNKDGDLVAPGSFGSGSKGFVLMNSRWQFNLAGIYQLPLGFEVSANLFAREGYPAPLSRRISTPFGRQVVALERLEDAERFDNIFNLDFRVSNTQDLGSAGSIAVDLDVFNVLNSDYVIQRNLRTEQSTFWQEREIIGPRIIRLGVRYRF